MAAISLTQHFLNLLVESLYQCIDAHFNVGKPSSSSFFYTYSLSTSSLGGKARYIIMSFLVLWSICWSSSLIHFKNGPEYLSSGIAKVFISLMKFPRYSLVSNSFNFFLSSPLVWWCPLPIFQSICKFPFLRVGSSISSVICHFPLFIMCTAYFSLANSTLMFWLYIVTACVRFWNCFSFLAHSLMSSMYIRWLIFSCNLIRLYPSVHFQNMWVTSSLSQIVMVITHLPGIYVSEFSTLLIFFLLLSAPLSSFSWFTREKFWLRQIHLNCIFRKFCSIYHFLLINTLLFFYIYSLNIRYRLFIY